MELDLRRFFREKASPGMKTSLEYEMDLSGLELDGVKPFCAPVRVSAQLQGGAGSVRLDVHLAYSLTMPCDRCGDIATKDVDTVLSHTLVSEVQDERDDDELIVVPEERFDLDELLREDILLDMPTKFLCREDCKGLCPKCGKNLNEGECSCAKRDIDPRLEKLKSLLEQ